MDEGVKPSDISPCLFSALKYSGRSGIALRLFTLPLIGSIIIAPPKFTIISDNYNDNVLIIIQKKLMDINRMLTN